MARDNLCNVLIKDIVKTVILFLLLLQYYEQLFPVIHSFVGIITHSYIQWPLSPFALQHTSLQAVRLCFVHLLRSSEPCSMS